MKDRPPQYDPRDSPLFGLSEISLYLLILCAGLIGIGAGAWFRDGAVIGISLLVVGFGGYQVVYALLGVFVFWAFRSATE